MFIVAGAFLVSRSCEILRYCAIAGVFILGFVSAWFQSDAPEVPEVSKSRWLRSTRIIEAFDAPEVLQKTEALLIQELLFSFLFFELLFVSYCSLCFCAY